MEEDYDDDDDDRFILITFFGPHFINNRKNWQLFCYKCSDLCTRVWNFNSGNYLFTTDTK